MKGKEERERRWVPKIKTVGEAKQKGREKNNVRRTAKQKEDSVFSMNPNLHSLKVIQSYYQENH